MMPVFAPLKETARGFQAFLLGLRWLRRHPRYLFLLMVPMVAGFAFFVGALALFGGYSEAILTWILFPRPEEWYLLALYYVSWGLLYIALLVLTFVGAILVTSVVASPIYEIVSVAVARDVVGSEAPGLGFWASLRVMLVELKKLVLILGVSILLLVVPGVNIVASLIAAFLVGWDFYDFPLARRGWSLRQRLRFVGREFFSVMGFGFWLIIPFVQFIVAPLAVPGGTLLNLEALKKRELLTAHGCSWREA